MVWIEFAKPINQRYECTVGIHSVSTYTNSNIVPLLDSTIVNDWKSFFCRSDLPVATSKSTV